MKSGYLKKGKAISRTSVCNKSLFSQVWFLLMGIEGVGHNVS